MEMVRCQVIASMTMGGINYTVGEIVELTADQVRRLPRYFKPVAGNEPKPESTTSAVLDAPNKGRPPKTVRSKSRGANAPQQE